MNRMLLAMMPAFVACSVATTSDAFSQSTVVRPKGAAPEFALLRTSGGKFIITRTVTKRVPVTRKRGMVVDGETKPILDTVQETVSENVIEEVPLDHFEFYTLSGQKYGKSGLAKLVKWLAGRKVPARVLLSKDGKLVDAYYRQFAAEGTLLAIRKVPQVAAPADTAKPLSAPPIVQPGAGTASPGNVKPLKDGESVPATGKKSTISIPTRSKASGLQVRIIFQNKAKIPVQLVWVDYEGREKNFGTIRPNEQIVQNSFCRYVWRVKVQGETVSAYCANEMPLQTCRISQPKYVLTTYEAEVFRLINQIRVNNGLSVLRHNHKLSAASRDHSRYMSRTGSFSHQSSDAGKYSFTDRASVFGTSAISENIAWDGGGPKSVVNMWMNSPGHQANILDPSATTMGIGHAGVYWTQMFGSGTR